MDSKFLIILGILVLVAVLQILVLMTADKRRRRALAVEENSNAWRIGLRKGDLIQDVNGRRITDARELVEQELEVRIG